MRWMTLSMVSLMAGCVGPWPEVRLTGPITSDVTLTATQPWLLDGVVFVEAGATLFIEPGTVIRGGPNSALVITRDARIEARGEPTRPVVFTSDEPVGSRGAGDWGGVVLLGRATVHEGTGAVEGVDESDPRGTYGGADDDYSCGVMQFVRIEYAGFFLDLDSDLNGLTLAGCGSGTIVENVQTHLSLDDGIEVVGGTVGLRNIVITYPGGQALDWSEGWRGDVQYFIVQHANPSGSAIEGENNDDEFDELPLSAPTIYNATLLGINDEGSASRGLILRAGTAGSLRNSLISGFGLDAVDLRDGPTVANAKAGTLQVRHTLLTDIGAGGNTYFDPDDSVSDDDGGYDESSWFFDADNMNLAVPKPVLPDAIPFAEAGTLRDLTPPVGAFTPDGDGIVADAPAARIPEGMFWDESAIFLGAGRPGEPDGEHWWDGWTAFPGR